jgi:hypothetical protein
MHSGDTRPVVSMSVWATPAPGQTMSQLVQALQAAGNPIMMVDGENGRVLIAKYDEASTNEEQA